MRLAGIRAVRTGFAALVSAHKKKQLCAGLIDNSIPFFYRYYVLVAACVFARKAEWLRNACLAAALLFPAVAAIHGIVLAAVHVNG
jgi:hypothetical protein